jgi:thiol:disulfide interchange protein DsbA
MLTRRLGAAARTVVLAVLSSVSVGCWAADGAASYELGKEYKEVREVQKPADPKRITIEEFFWYGCPHCFHLDPELTAWVAKKPADVDFSRIPNTLGRPEGEVHARAFYIAQALGIGEKIHKPLFDAIHVQHYPMSSLESIRALFVEVSGIKPADFDNVSSSLVVDSNLNRAEVAARTYGITSVPQMVIGGKYVVGAQQDTFKVVDFVIDKIRKERKG